MPASNSTAMSLTVDQERSRGASRRRNPALTLLHAVGSLYYAAVLLILLLVAMACATVYESIAGTERALVEMYHSWWFEGLLALLAVNVAASLVVHYPFSRRQIGFVVTHSAILLTLAGAFVTEHFGINDGQVGLSEGQSSAYFTRPLDTLTIENRPAGSETTADLASRDFQQFVPVDQPDAPVLHQGDLRVEVARYVPDSELTEQVVDDNPHLRHAVEVSLSEAGTDAPTWVFANRPAPVGSQILVYRVITDPEEFAKEITSPAAPPAATDGVVKVVHKGASFQLPLSQCVQQAVPIGDTGYTVRVLRYFPHANVGPDNKLRNLSDRPENPAIEIELDGPEGTETRFAFSRFPDFGTMHGGDGAEAMKVTFAAPTGQAETPPIELLAGPDGTLHVRFAPKPDRILSRLVTVGEPVESPWPLQRFAVLRRFEHARIDTSVTPVEPREKARIPAVLLSLSAGTDSSEMWIQKFSSRPVTVAGTPYQISYGNKTVPLGFTLRLDRFNIGFYPGGGRPRSFESHVTIVDPASGGTQGRVISMNNPTRYGGYTLFQSSYRMDGRRKSSYLSVARDPGQPIVFTGYIMMMAGVGIVLFTRTRERRRVPPGAARLGGIATSSRLQAAMEAAGRNIRPARGAARTPPEPARRTGVNQGVTD